MKRLCLFSIATLALIALALPTWAQLPETTFNLDVNPPFINCVGTPFGPTPTAMATVRRGELNDELVLTAHNLRPNTGFDLFTTQNSNLLADGRLNPNFHGFGLAWYQSDLQSDANGDAEVTIKTILLDQIFGFDPAVALTPVNTFHLGFWFNNPADAVSCGFKPTQITPFNGEHHAGPNAMMSVPNSQTSLGPLCTNPEQEGDVFICHP